MMANLKNLPVFFMMCCVVQAVQNLHQMFRNVTTTYNEKCNITFCKESVNGSFTNLYHIAACGENDTLHFLWSSYGALTGIVVRTNNDAILNINWTMLENKERGAIYFTPQNSELYSSAVIFSKLIEYLDKHDNASLVDNNMTSTTPFENLKWGNLLSSLNERAHSAVFQSLSFGDERKGNLSLKVQGFSNNDRGPVLPRLLHTSNNSYFELTLNNLSTSYPHSRFAVELVFIGPQDRQTNGTSFHSISSIADQYTPAVFYVDVVDFYHSNMSQGGFVSWKPVTYTQPNRRSSGKLVKEYGLKRSADLLLPSYSIAHAYYADFKMWDITAMNVSFGSDEDGFYKATNFSVWGGVVGYGEVAEDQLSILIIIIMSAGLGIPVALIVFGGFVMCIRKIFRKKKEHVLIVDSVVN